MTKRKFTDAQEKEICRQYFSEEKPSTIVLENRRGCSEMIISGAIKRNGYVLRISKFYKGHKAWNKEFTEKEEQEICEEYLNKKISSMVLSKKWNCNDSTIRNIIRKKGYKIRSLSDALKGRKIWSKGLTKEIDIRLIHSEETKRKLSKFTKEQEQQICNEYFSKEKPSTTILAKKWNCTQPTIWNIIVRNGHKLRTLSEALSGEKHPLYGTHLSDETKQKISITEKGKETWNKNKKASIKTKEKMSTSALRRIQNQHGPYKNTKPELKMKELLNKLNIPFEHQFRLGNHNFDFHILNTNILIEVDGNYWHGNPKIFSKLNKMQLEIKQRDIKYSKIAKINGFILLRFWEDDILNNGNIVKDKLRSVNA